MGLGADILAIDDRESKSVIVPQWNGAEVYVRVMGAKERAVYEARLLDLAELDLSERIFQIKVCTVVLCACDENMNRLWTDDQFDQVAEKNGDAIDIVFTAADKLNLITPERVEEEAGN